MSPEIPWRALCPEIVRCRQLQALYGPTMFLVRRPGPLSLVLKGSANGKPIRVRLSGVHWCSCKTFSVEKELCVHLCWGLLRLFRIMPTNPLSFQLGMVEREIATSLKSAVPVQSGLRRSIFDQLPSPSEITQILPKLECESGLEKLPTVAPRILSQQDSCPICLEPLLQKPVPVTHCRHSCGNHVHMRCMQIWIKHHHEDSTDLKVLQTIKCPVCRGVFNYDSDMKQEMENAPKERPKKPPATTLPPLSTKRASAYAKQQADAGVMSLLDSLLASQHNQEVRNERSAEAAAGIAISASASSSSSGGSGASNAAALREIIAPVAIHVLVRALPEWKVPPRHRLLAPGRQCCICLSHYEAGERVSGLPCGHEYHTDCLKSWLQRQSTKARIAKCPIDSIDLTPWLTERLITMQKTACREPFQAKGSRGGPSLTSEAADFSIRSSRLPLINRLHLIGPGQQAHSCGHLATPPPEAASPLPPPAPAPSSSNSRPSTGRRSRLAAHSAAAAVLHLVSISLPPGKGAAPASGWIGSASHSRRRPRRREEHTHWQDTRLNTPQLTINCNKINLKARI